MKWLYKNQTVKHFLMMKSSSISQVNILANWSKYTCFKMVCPLANKHRWSVSTKHDSWRTGLVVLCCRMLSTARASLLQTTTGARVAAPSIHVTESEKGRAAKRQEWVKEEDVEWRHRWGFGCSSAQTHTRWSGLSSLQTWRWTVTRQHGQHFSSFLLTPNTERHFFPLSSMHTQTHTLVSLSGLTALRCASPTHLKASRNEG